jgi:hypothetical protein
VLVQALPRTNKKLVRSKKRVFMQQTIRSCGEFRIVDRGCGSIHGSWII